jgi:hypothetical protein
LGFVCICQGPVQAEGRLGRRRGKGRGKEKGGEGGRRREGRGGEGGGGERSHWLFGDDGGQLGFVCICQGPVQAEGRVGGRREGKERGGR